MATKKKPSGPSKTYAAHRQAGEHRLVAWLPEGLVDAIETQAKREGVSVTMISLRSSGPFTANRSSCRPAFSSPSAYR